MARDGDFLLFPPAKEVDFAFGDRNVKGVGTVPGEFSNVGF